MFSALQRAKDMTRVFILNHKNEMEPKLLPESSTCLTLILFTAWEKKHNALLLVYLLDRTSCRLVKALVCDSRVAASVETMSLYHMLSLYS